MSKPLAEEDITDEDVKVLDKSNFDYVRFTFADINGLSRSKTIIPKHVKEFIKKGISIYTGVLALGISGEVCSLREIEETRYGNGLLRPMPGTLHRVPWATSNPQMKIGQFLCETFWTKPYRDGGHQSTCPRFLARKQLDRLQQLGYDLYSASESEFCIFEKDLETPIYLENGMFSNQVMDRHGDLLYDMERCLRGSGVDVEVIHSEYSQGQFEMVLQPTYGIAAADQVFRLRDGIKATAYQNNKVATFMTRPMFSQMSSGMHYNHSLWSSNSKTNAFYDSTKSDGLSKVAKSWFAGLVRHAKAITALCSPTVNCYRRLHTPFIPSKANWGIEDRSCAYRIKNHGPNETYVENRLPSSASNPYLVLAATVAAGIDGLINDLECPPPEQSDEALLLAKSLEQSLEFLEQDEAITSALGEEFIRWFTTLKRESEIKKTKDFDFDSKEAFENEKKIYFEFV